MANICQNPLLLEIAHRLPSSLYKLQKYFSKNASKYTTYAVCPKCSALYDPKDCIIKTGSIEESRKCEHIEFPNHPQRSRRSKCGTVLMKRIKLGAKYKMVPRKTFVYQSIVESLKEMSCRPGFLPLCEKWRQRTLPPGELGDIYDGQIWKEMRTVDGRPFLSNCNNFCLGINIDWFNPYSETKYSAGAIYLTIFNLPRAERFKIENIILVGMIPGPNEPSNINPYLAPLVDELNSLYKGITFKNPSSLLSMTSIRAMLVAIMCDLPATRKVCGFANFNAIKGCSKCLKEFPTDSFGVKPDYSGYNVECWISRDASTHRREAKKAKSATTATRRKSIEKAYGAKHSILLDLPYIDIVRNHVVDPMHNIFLGMAKHAFKTWTDLELLTPRKCHELQEHVDSLNPPPKVGRIPRKIGSGFASLTADEWKHWVLMYSMYALRNILPESHYKCWTLFVESCRILTMPIITRVQIERGHSLLVEYCKKFETLYGSEYCTPNMHMACHIKECMLDYGPLSSFWCFAFERFNGTLEGVQKSWNCPEKQMFSKFLGMQEMRTIQKTIGSDQHFASIIFQDTVLFKEPLGFDSLNQSSVPDIITSQQLQHHNCIVSLVDAEEKPFQYLVPPIKEKCFTDPELSLLKQMYEYLYPNSSIQQLSRFYFQSKQLIINEEEFISTHSRSQRSCSIVAHWPGVIAIDARGEAPMRVGVITQFFRHEITCVRNPQTEPSNVSRISHILAHIKWYMAHPRRDYFHSSMIISASVFQPDSPASYLPVSRIAARCAIAKTEISFDYGKDSVTIAVPMLKNFSLL